MTAKVHVDHTYTFTFHERPTAEQLIQALRQAQSVMGENCKVTIKSSENQLDGYTMKCTVHGA